MDLREVNSLVLAYLGDSVYEIYVRKFLINHNISNVNNLQKAAIKYVSAKAQSMFLNKMIEVNFLTDEEMNVVKRARNCKCASHPKNCDIITYKYATGLEALIGYLELSNNIERVDKIMNFIFENGLC